MTQVLLELPNEIAEQARSVAEYSHRSLEAVLLEWINRSATQTPISQLPDEEVLALVDLQLSPEDQERLSYLLYENQNGTLTDETREELDALMQVYRSGMVRKSEALYVAVQRGLRPSLDADDGADKS